MSRKEIINRLAQVNTLRKETAEHIGEIREAAHNRELWLLKAIQEYRDRLQEKVPGDNPIMERRYRVLLDELSHVRRILAVESNSAQRPGT